MKERAIMTAATLKAIREIADGNAIYNPNDKTLEIKNGRMAGKYINIGIDAAIEIAQAN
jgi:hypothetical protein